MLIQIPAADGTAEALVARPSTGSGPFPGVILYMDAFGLRPRIEDMAQRVADRDAVYGDVCAGAADLLPR